MNEYAKNTTLQKYTTDQWFPAKSPQFCQNTIYNQKSIYNPRRKKDYLLFSEISSFKRSRNMDGKEGELFNVTMGVYDSAEICGNL